jgi:hypothetical protein
MAKKNEPITTWQTSWTWDWHWFSVGVACDIKSKFYMVQLGFLHFMCCRVTKYLIGTPKRKKK